MIVLSIRGGDCAIVPRAQSLYAGSGGSEWITTSPRLRFGRDNRAQTCICAGDRTSPNLDVRKRTDVFSTERYGSVHGVSTTRSLRQISAKVKPVQSWCECCAEISAWSARGSAARVHAAVYETTTLSTALCV